MQNPIDSLSALESQVEELKKPQVGFNLPIRVRSYDGDKVIGTDLRFGEDGPLITVSLYDDKKEGSRETARKSIAERAIPDQPLHVAPGGILAIERAYQNNDGTYSGGWIQNLAKDNQDGLVQRQYVSLKYFEGDPDAAYKPRAPSIIASYYKPSDSVRITNMDELKAFALMALAPKEDIPVITPSIAIRASQNGRGCILAEISLNRKKVEGQQYKVYETPAETLASILKPGTKTSAILESAFKAAPVVIEVIPGGKCFLPKSELEKAFTDDYKLKVKSASGGPTEHGIKHAMFTGKKGSGEDAQTIALYADGWFGIKRTKTSGILIPRFISPLETRPKMVELGNIPTIFFNPNAALVVESKADLSTSEPTPETTHDDDEDSLNLAAEEAAAAQELGNMFARKPGRM